MMYAALSTARGQRPLHFVASVERGPVHTGRGNRAVPLVKRRAPRPLR